MNFKKFFVVFLIFAIPIFAYMVLSAKNESSAKKVNDNISKPQIIKFTSIMCFDCKRLGENLQKVYPKYSDKILLTEIQVQNNDEYTNNQIKKYNVSLVPTIILLDKNNKVLKKVEGYIEENDLEKMMKDLCNE